jgi:uncharacterized protein (DUF2141 family)
MPEMSDGLRKSSDVVPAGARLARGLALAGPLLALSAAPALPTVQADDARQAEALADPSGPSKGRIVVDVESFRNDQGDALFALFRTSEGFPKEPLKAARRVASAIANAHSQVVFDDVEPGEFAVSVLHDEDGDREVKTGMLGIPREGIGFSRDARAVFGPPKYKNAQLTLAPGANVTVLIHMHYY